MSKALKKLIDINRLREFKNKLVGAGSAYVQTGAVDQTIAGTKTFSKPVVGSVTGSSGSCTGNAATATKATQDSDGNQINTTYSKVGHTHDDRYYTETEVNNLLKGKANTSGTYSNLTVGNAGSATNATYANWLRTSSHSDHLFHTEWDNAGYFWTYVTTGNGEYRAVRVARSDSATNADHATRATQDSDGNQINTTYSKVGHTHDDRYYTEIEVNNLLAVKANTSHTHRYVQTPDGHSISFDWSSQVPGCVGLTVDVTKMGGIVTTATLSAYATKTELNNGLTTKANNSEVVHKSGNETIAGIKTFNDTVHANGFHSTAANALMAQCGEYTLVLRNDGDNTYLLMSDKGGVPGTWSSARPLVISNSRGVCDINGNAAAATNATYADWLRTSSHSDHLFHTEWDNAGYFRTYVTAPDGGYRAVRVARSDSAAIAEACTASAIRAQWYAAYPDGAEAHNAMWGGRDITAAFNNGTVSANIANGTFKDIFPGDYITKQVTISGKTYTINWVVADCDYWINKGHDPVTTAHHVAIVPQQPIFNYPMNGTNNTVGGYADSRMYTSIIPDCATGIINAFGGEHILTFRDLITTMVDNNVASRGYCGWTGASAPWEIWESVECNLMTEHMVMGAPCYSSSGIDDEITTRQMSAFRLSEKLINYNRQNWWLRNVVSSATFAAVDDDGCAAAVAASSSLGVRPFALLI